MKKFLALLMAVIMVFSLCACGQQAATTATEAAPAAEEAAPAVEEAAPAEKVTLVMQNIWCGSDSKANQWSRIVSEFNAEYDGVYEVVLEDQADYDSYADKLKTLISSGDTPDLFTFKEGYRTLYSKSGELMNIGELVYGSDFESRFQADTLKGAEYEGTLYCLPYETAIVPMMFNTSLLSAAGVDALPTDYDEMYATSEKIAATGVYPIVQSTGSNAWFAQLWHSYCLASVMGANIYDYAYDSPEWIEATELYKSLMVCSEDDMIGSDTSVVNGNFFNERGAMYINGTWILGRIASEGVEGLTDKIDIGGTLSYNGKNGGGYMSVVQAYIGAAKTEDPNKKAAVAAFLEFVTRPEQVLPLCQESGSLFAASIDNSQLKEGLQTKIIDAGANATFLFDHIQNKMSTQVWAVYNDNISAYLLGDLTAEEFCGMLAQTDAES